MGGNSFWMEVFEILYINGNPCNVMGLICCLFLLNEGVKGPLMWKIHLLFSYYFKHYFLYLNGRSHYPF